MCSTSSRMSSQLAEAAALVLELGDLVAQLAVDVALAFVAAVPALARSGLLDLLVALLDRLGSWCQLARALELLAWRPRARALLALRLLAAALRGAGGGDVGGGAPALEPPGGRARARRRPARPRPTRGRSSPRPMSRPAALLGQDDERDERREQHAPAASAGTVPRDAFLVGPSRARLPAGPVSRLARMDERVLAERLIAADTSTLDGLRGAAGFVKGWLEARDIEVAEHDYNGLPVLRRGGRAAEAPGRPDGHPPRPRRRGPRARRAVRAADRGRPAHRPRRLRHEGRPRHDDVRAARRRRAGPRPRRASSACPTRSPRTSRPHSIDWLVREHGIKGDFAITGEPTDLHIGIQAKGVLALRVLVHGTAAHGSTPWVGDNAILKAHDAFRRIETLPFSRESLGPVRPPEHQPRAHQRRRRVQQGARPLRDGRRHPLPPEPGPRRDPRPDPRDPRPRDRPAARPGRRPSSRARTRTCSRCATPSRASPTTSR